MINETKVDKAIIKDKNIFYYFVIFVQSYGFVFKNLRVCHPCRVLCSA